MTGSTEAKRKKMFKQFEKLARPLIKYLNNNWNPHTKIIISHDYAEISSGEMAFHTDDYIND